MATESAMSHPFLTTSSLTKHFGETRALQDVSIEVFPGLVHTVLGENGSGKSTLVKVLSGIIKQDSGTIVVSGKPVNASQPAAMINMGIAIVLQEVLIVPNRSVTENILLGHDQIFTHHRSFDEKREVARETLSCLTSRKIDPDVLAGNLALHEQQLVVIARGFARNPRLLILDEVTAALDLADRDMLFRHLQNYSQQGGAAIFVSHRMPEIMELSNTVFIMHNGHNTAQLTGKDINPKTLLAHLTQEGIDA